MKTKMNNLLKKIRTFWKNADAQDLVEYALLLMMISLASVASMNSLARSVRNAFSKGTLEMTELSIPGGTSVSVANAATSAADNAAANANAAASGVAAGDAAAAAAQAAADLAAATADIGNVTSTTFGRGFTRTTTGPASTADIAAAIANNSADAAAVADYNAYTAANGIASSDTAVAIDDNSAAADDAAAAIAASLGVDTATVLGVGIGADQLTADANAETAAATGKTATGSFLGF